MKESVSGNVIIDLCDFRKGVAPDIQTGPKTLSEDVTLFVENQGELVKVPEGPVEVQNSQEQAGPEVDRAAAGRVTAHRMACTNPVSR